MLVGSFNKEKVHLEAEALRAEGDFTGRCGLKSCEVNTEQCRNLKCWSCHQQLSLNEAVSKQKEMK